MNATALVAPVRAGREEEWKKFSLSLQEEPRRSEYAAFMAKCGVSRIRCWMQQTPHGMVGIVLYEGETPGGFGQQIATSQEPFAVWFRERVLELHGMDMSGPLPPPPELVTDVQAP